MALSFHRPDGYASVMSHYPGDIWLCACVRNRMGLGLMHAYVSLALDFAALLFLICNHVTMQPCWGSIQQNFSSKNSHENRVQFPEERNAFVLNHHHGLRDVTCKPAIYRLAHRAECPDIINYSQSFECERALNSQSRIRRERAQIGQDM